MRWDAALTAKVAAGGPREDLGVCSDGVVPKLGGRGKAGKVGYAHSLLRSLGARASLVTPPLPARPLAAAMINFAQLQEDITTCGEQQT